EAGVFTLGVFAHADEVDVVRGLAVQRPLQPRKEAHRPYIRILLERLADGQKQLPEGDVVGHGRPAHGAEVDGVEAAQRVQAIRRHHPAVLLVVGTAPGEALAPDAKAEYVGCRAHHAHTFVNDVAANAIPGDQGYVVLFHGSSLGWLAGYSYWQTNNVMIRSEGCRCQRRSMNRLSYAALQTPLFGLLFLIFLQLLTEFVAAIYAFGLLGVSIPVEIVAVLLLFSPLLLFLLPRGLNPFWLRLLPLLVLVARGALPLLSTRGRLFVAGLGVALFLFWLPAWLAAAARRREAWATAWTLGAGLLL